MRKVRAHRCQALVETHVVLIMILLIIVIFRHFVTRWVHHADKCTRCCGGLFAEYFKSLTELCPGTGPSTTMNGDETTEAWGTEKPYYALHKSVKVDFFSQICT